jgi:TM2 domain-containing membrane protein YozV
MSDPFSSPPNPSAKKLGRMVKAPGAPRPSEPRIGGSKTVSTESHIVQSLSASVQHALNQMDAQSQNAFFSEYEVKRKSVAVARLLSFLFGWHYIYLRKTGMQFLYWASWFIWIGFFWWIVDLVRMRTKVAAANEMVAREILQNLAIGNQFKNSAPPA